MKKFENQFYYLFSTKLHFCINSVIEKRKYFWPIFIFGVTIFSTGLHADSSNWGLRLSGGYGFSMNSQGLQSGTGTLNTYTGDDTLTSSYSAATISCGTPIGAELLYSCTSRLQVSLGIFPIFSTPEYSSSSTFAEIPASANDYSYTENQRANITYLPVLLSLYFNQPMRAGFNAFVGFGLGVVPSTSFTWTTTFTNASGSSPANTTEYETLDAGFVLRGVLGADYHFKRRYKIFSSFRVGAEIQDLVFDQTILYGNTISGGTVTAGQGWTGQTADFNQWEPMLFVEGDL